MKSGTELIAEERTRQIKKWGILGDDHHCNGEMAEVAAGLAICHSYPHTATVDGLVIYNDEYGNLFDNWGLIIKHSSNPVKALTVAGALIAAEIDRLNRNNKSQENP